MQPLAHILIDRPKRTFFNVSFENILQLCDAFLINFLIAKTLNVEPEILLNFQNP